MTDLSNAASNLFKFTQNVGASLPPELDICALTSVELQGEPEVGPQGQVTIDLASATLPNPVGSIRDVVSLLKLVNHVTESISNRRLYLSEEFADKVEILAANIGAVRPMLSLSLIVNGRELAAYQDSRHVRFNPGAAIDPEYALPIIANLRSTGLGDFVAIEETSRFNRIYFSGVRSPA